MRRRTLPPPEQLTLRDVVHIILALLMIPLGITVLVRTLQVAPTALGVAVGLAFVGFGAYRLWQAVTRYIAYRKNKGGNAQ
jgi:hypothetical protein